ncbi:MAG: DUF1127 domain-containing protein [Granulosicoccus sp.]
MGYSSRLEINKAQENSPQISGATWRLWLHRYRTRKQLFELLLNDRDRLHRDIGLSTEAALNEVKKPFWRR